MKEFVFAYEKMIDMDLVKQRLVGMTITGFFEVVYQHIGPSADTRINATIKGFAGDVETLATGLRANTESDEEKTLSEKLDEFSNFTQTLKVHEPGAYQQRDAIAEEVSRRVRQAVVPYRKFVYGLEDLETSRIAQKTLFYSKLRSFNGK